MGGGFPGGKKKEVAFEVYFKSLVLSEYLEMGRGARQGRETCKGILEVGRGSKEMQCSDSVPCFISWEHREKLVMGNFPEEVRHSFLFFSLLSLSLPLLCTHTQYPNKMTRYV